MVGTLSAVDIEINPLGLAVDEIEISALKTYRASLDVQLISVIYPSVGSRNLNSVKVVDQNYFRRLGSCLVITFTVKPVLVLVELSRFVYRVADDVPCVERNSGQTWNSPRASWCFLSMLMFQT